MELESGGDKEWELGPGGEWEVDGAEAGTVGAGSNVQLAIEKKVI